MRASVHHLSRASLGPHAIISLVCVCVTRRRRGSDCARYLCSFHLSELLNITFYFNFVTTGPARFYGIPGKSVINWTLFRYARNVINDRYVGNLGTEIEIFIWDLFDVEYTYFQTLLWAVSLSRCV